VPAIYGAQKQRDRKLHERQFSCECGPSIADVDDLDLDLDNPALQPKTPRVRDPGLFQAARVRGTFEMRKRIRCLEEMLLDAHGGELALLERLAEEVMKVFFFCLLSRTLFSSESKVNETLKGY